MLTEQEERNARNWQVLLSRFNTLRKDPIMTKLSDALVSGENTA